jgi:hypothetical protein
MFQRNSEEKPNKMIDSSALSSQPRIAISCEEMKRIAPGYRGKPENFDPTKVKVKRQTAASSGEHLSWISDHPPETT